jgi:serine/threonine protein kinase
MEMASGSLGKLTPKYNCYKLRYLKCFNRIKHIIHDLHAKNCAHGDIFPGNILYFETNKKMSFKLSDFGNARCIGDILSSFKFFSTRKLEAMKNEDLRGLNSLF